MKAEFSLESSVISALNLMAEKQNRKPDEIVADLITAAHLDKGAGEVDPKIIRFLRKVNEDVEREGGMDYDNGGRAWLESLFTDNPLPEPPKCRD